MDTDYKTRVEAGMAWLDSVKPGWERSIDLATFDIKSGCDCVLGQVFAAPDTGLSGFARGVSRLDRENKPVHAYGFGLDGMGESFLALEAEWRTAIKARFDTGVLSDDVAEVRPA